MQHSSFCFILIERDSFIARDLREGLAEACPHCRCLQMADLSDLVAAEAELQNLSQLPVLITKANLQDLRSSGIDDVVRRNGWTIAMRMGTDPLADIHANGWLSVPAPFSREDLLYLVEQLRARYPLMDRRSA